jgi:hypothetical protein
MKKLFIIVLCAMLTACGGGNDMPNAPAEPQPAVFPGLGLVVPPPVRAGGTPAICTITNSDGSQTTYHCVK